MEVTDKFGGHRRFEFANAADMKLAAAKVFEDPDVTGARCYAGGEHVSTLERAQPRAPRGSTFMGNPAAIGRSKV